MSRHVGEDRGTASIARDDSQSEYSGLKYDVDTYGRTQAGWNIADKLQWWYSRKCCQLHRITGTCQAFKLTTKTWDCRRLALYFWMPLEEGQRHPGRSSVF